MTMKKIMKRALSLTLAATLLLPASGLASGWVDDWLDQRTTTSPDYFSGQKRGYYSAGSFNARWRSNADYPITVEMPRIKSGCGGIDMFMGGFSFMDFEYLVEKFERILANAGAVAFDLALKTLCEPCATTVKSIDALVNQLNSMQLDECTAAQSLVAVLDDGSGGFASMETISKNLSSALKENKLTQGIEDLYQSITETDRANQNVPQQADVERAVSGCNAEIKEIFLSDLVPGGSSLLYNLGVVKMGLDEKYIDLIRGLVGDIRIEGPEKAFLVHFISPCPQNDPDDVKSFIDGNVVARNRSGTCYQITDANRDLVNYVQSTMERVADGIRRKSVPASNDLAFIQSSPLSPLPVLKVAVSTDMESSTIASMSELTAKAYTLQIFSDLYSRASRIMEKTKEMMGKKAVAATGQDSENCTAAIFADNLDKQVSGMIESIDKLKYAARDSYTTSAKEMTTIMNMLRYYQQAESKIYAEITKRYGRNIADRVKEL